MDAGISKWVSGGTSGGSLPEAFGGSAGEEKRNRMEPDLQARLSESGQQVSVAPEARGESPWFPGRSGIICGRVASLDAAFAATTGICTTHKSSSLVSLGSGKPVACPGVAVSVAEQEEPPRDRVALFHPLGSSVHCLSNQREGLTSAHVFV